MHKLQCKNSDNYFFLIVERHLYVFIYIEFGTQMNSRVASARLLYTRKYVQRCRYAVLYTWNHSTAKYDIHLVHVEHLRISIYEITVSLCQIHNTNSINSRKLINVIQKEEEKKQVKIIEMRKNVEFWILMGRNSYFSCACLNSYINFSCNRRKSTLFTWNL